MSQFQVLKIMGALFPGVAGEAIGMILFTAGLVLWALVPFYDTREKAARRAKKATYFGILVICILVGTTIWGYLGLK